jgi:hypothetical protein
MEDINKEKSPQLSLKSKSQLHFGIDFSHKISNLKVFIYGLRGVSIINNEYNSKIVRSRNFKKFNIIRSFSVNFI